MAWGHLSQDPLCLDGEARARRHCDLPKALPEFQKERGLGPGIWEVQSQCPGTVVCTTLGRTCCIPVGANAAQTLGPSSALSRTCAEGALTSHVPPANGHKALEERFAGVLTRHGHTMQPDEQHPMAMLLVALGA